MRHGLLVGLIVAFVTSGCGGGKGGVGGGQTSRYRVPSAGMKPTLKRGELVNVMRLVSSPHVGDIVTYHPPVAAECGPKPHLIKPGGEACSRPVLQESGGTFVQRIVAGPGDSIAISEGHVIRNGKREEDSYIEPCQKDDPACNFPTPIKIRSGYWFLMGDNRGNTIDSRSFGPVPTSWLIGVVQLPAT